jgi:hypothetical protein
MLPDSGGEWSAASERSQLRGQNGLLLLRSLQVWCSPFFPPYWESKLIFYHSILRLSLFSLVYQVTKIIITC